MSQRTTSDRKSSPSAEKIITLADARALSVRAQGLAEDAPFGLGKAGVLAAIKHLGYVQVDTISVLQRAHHHVLWSRVPDYKSEMLHELQAEDVEVFEYWNHAASVLPICDFRFSRPLMQKYRRKLHWSVASAELEKAMRRMQSRIRRKGALRISEVESAGAIKSWGDTSFGKIERRALHELWMRGDIMIRHRQGFEKVFDLPERVLPSSVENRMPGKKDAAEFHVRRALRALGIARSQELHYLQDGSHAANMRAALASLIKRGEVVELRVAEYPTTPVFALQDRLVQLAPLGEKRVRFLSPFDNATIQRKRLQWLFDFEYTVEIYVPPAKRKYGYFVLPILWGDQIIGRMDAKAFRHESRLVIHLLTFEPKFSQWEEAKPAFLDALESFTRFQQCTEWEITHLAANPNRGWPMRGKIKS